MKAELTLCSRIVVAVLLAALLLLPAGCGEPKQDPAQFVGTWDRYYGEDAPLPSYPETLKFRGDGTAVKKGGPSPHAEELIWTLYRDRLVLTPRGGVTRTTYDYRFNGPDELILIIEGNDVPFRRAQESAPSPEPEQPPAEPSN